MSSRGKLLSFTTGRPIESLSEELERWTPCGQLGSMACMGIMTRRGKTVAVFETTFSVSGKLITAMKVIAQNTQDCEDVLFVSTTPGVGSVIELTLDEKSLKDRPGSNHGKRVGAAYFFREHFVHWANRQAQESHAKKSRTKRSTTEQGDNVFPFKSPSATR